jgi:hypothetical protein
MENKGKTLREIWHKKNQINYRHRTHAEIKANAKKKLELLSSVEMQRVGYEIQQLKSEKEEMKKWETYQLKR